MSKISLLLTIVLAWFCAANAETKHCSSMQFRKNPEKIITGDKRFFASAACQHEYNVWYWALREKGLGGAVMKGHCNWFASYACAHACLTGCMKGHIPSKPGHGCFLNRCFTERPYWDYLCDCGVHPVTKKNCTTYVNFEQAYALSLACERFSGSNSGNVWSKKFPNEAPFQDGRLFLGNRKSLNEQDWPTIADGRPCKGLEEEFCEEDQHCVWKRRICRDRVSPEHCQQFDCIDSVRK